MKRILLLGGTAEALRVAHTLALPHVYSLAGLGKIPEDLACHVRVGGFGGVAGLARYIEEQGITLLLDITHPYAAQMSNNASIASQQTGIPCWALRREEWQPQPEDQWTFVDDWPALLQALQNFKRPFFTSGREPLAHLKEIPAHQYWTIRCLDVHPPSERATVIGVRGPFTLEDERTLFSRNDFDVLISKNSGSIATEPKLQVARERKMPVLVMKRPSLPDVTRHFTALPALQTAVLEYLQ